MKEIWRPTHIFCENYSVSNFGKVRREKAYRGLYAHRILKPQITKGYFHVTLHHHSVRKIMRIHILVANAFIGPCPQGKQVNHKDTKKLNNHVNNLEYLTCKDNIRHAVKAGLWNPPRGSKNKQAKLVENDIPKIRHLYSEKKLNQRQIAKIYKVNPSVISEAISRKSWAHVP